MSASTNQALSRRATLKAGRDIRRALTPLEEAVDDTILKHAELVIAIVQGRRDASASIDSGHGALMHATASLNALRDVREHMLRCHRELVETRDAYALDPSEVGCTSACLGSRNAAEVAQLQAVA
jgi:hypothetical protein